MNSNISKPRKFDYVHLVYNFTVPLRIVFHTSNTGVWNQLQKTLNSLILFPLFLSFVLILFYFRATVMKIWSIFEYIYLLLLFVRFWYFFHFVKFEMLASRLWKSLLFLTHPSWDFSWVFCMPFSVIWISFF